MKRKYRFQNATIILENQRIEIRQSKLQSINQALSKGNVSPKTIDVKNLDSVKKLEGKLKPYIIIKHNGQQEKIRYNPLSPKSTKFTQRFNKWEGKPTQDEEFSGQEEEENSKFKELKNKFEEGDLTEEEYKDRLENLLEVKKNSEKRDKEDKTSSKTLHEEYKRTCRECGNVWHVSKNELEELRKAKKNNSIAGIATALTGNLAASAQTAGNKQSAERRLEELNKCPECKSRNYEQTET